MSKSIDRELAKNLVARISPDQRRFMVKECFKLANTRELDLHVEDLCEEWDERCDGREL